MIFKIMSDQTERSERSEGGTEVAEQITMDPTPVKEKDSKKREKDPKKVAAGKKLAEYNKKSERSIS